MNAQARWQDIISQNLSAGSIPGYRKREVSFSAVEAGFASGATNGRQAVTVMPAAQVGTNFKMGEMRPTQNQFDFALDGPGFFEVQLPGGAKAYTRDGEFHLSPEGQLVTKQGYVVASDAGAIQFDPNNGGAITVSSNGFVSQGGEVKGSIRMVEFENMQELQMTSGGYFLVERPEIEPLPAQKTTLRQGYIEMANSSPMIEMGNLVTSMRMFEANQRVLQMQDERMGKVINELGHA